MPRDYDPTLKVVVEASPSDWLVLDGRPRYPVTDISPEVTAVLSGAADRFLRVDAPEPYVHHLDFQSGHDSAALPPRVHLYHSVAEFRTGLPVHSVAVLLRPEADSPQVNGRWHRRMPGAVRFYRIFRYGVLRVWQTPAAAFLNGGPGTMPLAPISAVAEADVPGVLRRMERRFRRGTMPLAPISAVAEADVPGVLRRMERRFRREPLRRELWAATRIIMGLRFPATTVDHLLRSVRDMKESTTYQATLAEGRDEGIQLGREEGRAEEARRMLLAFGERTLGPADEEVRRALEAIGDPERLEDLARRLPDAASWTALLGLPTPRRRGRRASS